MPAEDADANSEHELKEMTDFWQTKAKDPGPPDPRPVIESVSTLIMIHRLADNLPSEQARKVQQANYTAFRAVISTG